jgi:NAD(P)-dependent dehydrogenase (short-subunit alcohol dehydrogenase family)
MSVLEAFSLKNRVAAVTGGNHGIGLAIARAFVEAGASVAIAARNEERNTEAVAELRGLGGQALSVRTDVSRRSDLEVMAATVESELGPIDILVNNAGFGMNSDALSVPDEEWERLLATNLDGVWKASQIIGRSMVSRGRGSIVNIGSISGLIINRPQWHAPYGIAKAAVHQLTRSLAAEWAQHHVRVNAIAPGFVRSHPDEVEPGPYRHYWIDEVPMQRRAEPDEIAPTALYLASDASSFVTGAVVVVDGGYTLW